MRRILPIIGLMLFVGCAAKVESYRGSSVGTGVGVVKGNIFAARENLVILKPHVLQAGRPILEVTDRALANANSAATDVGQQLSDFAISADKDRRRADLAEGSIGYQTEWFIKSAIKQTFVWVGIALGALLAVEILSKLIGFPSITAKVFGAVITFYRGVRHPDTGPEIQPGTMGRD